MKEICELCEAAIEAGSVSRDPVLTAHLAECAGCREFAAFEAEVLAVDPVVPEKMPALSDILAERERRHAVRRNSIRLAAWPLALAAAAMLAVTGVRFVLLSEPVPGDIPGEVAPVMQTAAVSEVDWPNLDEAFWNADSLNMSWDNISGYETALAVLRQDNSVWNIEEFNPIEEELDI